MPNGAHRAIAELERRGLVSGVVTQNIDGLHALAGSSPIEVHGSIRTASCLACGASYSLADTRARVPLPLCDCGAVLKPDVVLFGEMLPERAMLQATALAHDRGPDARGRLVLGGLAGRRPARGHAARGRKLAIVTMGETPYDRYAEVKLSGDVVAGARGGRRRARSLRGVEGAGAERGFEAGEGGGDDLDARRLEAALAGGEGRGADRVEVAAELLEAVGEVAVGDPAGELGDRGGQRSLELKCSFRVAASSRDRRGRGG